MEILDHDTYPALMDVDRSLNANNISSYCNRPATATTFTECSIRTPGLGYRYKKGEELGKSACMVTGAYPLTLKSC